MNKPREWIIDSRPHSGHRGGETRRYTAWEGGYYAGNIERRVEVIEKSAYRALLAEIEILKARLVILTTPVTVNVDA
jgi:hypothetical protein